MSRWSIPAWMLEPNEYGPLLRREYGADAAFLRGARQAYINGHTAGARERGALFRLLAASIAHRFQHEGDDDLFRAADRVCQILCQADGEIWPGLHPVCESEGEKR